MDIISKKILIFALKKGNRALQVHYIWSYFYIKPIFSSHLKIFTFADFSKPLTLIFAIFNLGRFRICGKLTSRKRTHH